MIILVICCFLIAFVAFVVLLCKPFLGIKKKTKAVIIIVAAVLIWNHMPYYYNNDMAVSYVTSHSAQHSRSMCAWYVIKAMWNGGCPIGLVPAYAYDKTLPQMGFEEIPSKGYVPKKGDISVLPQNEESSFGHIAIYDGERWVSDFKQKSLYPNSTYKKNGNEKLFRADDGWHWKHVWTSPMDWYDWMKSLVRGFNKIKF
jgi:hypothetical protein